MKGKKRAPSLFFMAETWLDGEDAYAVLDHLINDCPKGNQPLPDMPNVNKQDMTAARVVLEPFKSDPTLGLSTWQNNGQIEKVDSAIARTTTEVVKENLDAQQNPGGSAV